MTDIQKTLELRMEKENILASNKTDKMIKDIKFTGKPFTRKECFQILKEYDKPLYNYYSGAGYLFGCDAMNYAQHLYISNMVKEIFEKYNIKHEEITSNNYRVYGNFEGFSHVEVSEHQLVLDGRCTTEEEFKNWCYQIREHDPVRE